MRLLALPTRARCGAPVWRWPRSCSPATKAGSSPPASSRCWRWRSSSPGPIARAIGSALRGRTVSDGAVAGFSLLSRGSTGAWFQTSGFFVPENPSLGFTRRGVDARSGAARSRSPDRGCLGAGLAGVAVSLIRARRTPAALLPLALLAAAALPLWAFYDGHPHRVRYMVPLVAGCAALAGLAIGALPSRLRAVGAVGLAAAAIVASPPLSPDRADGQRSAVGNALPAGAARRHRPRSSRCTTAARSSPAWARSATTRRKRRHAGFDIADFLHEGNGDLWTSALQSPRRHVRWILIEEQAEGGDLLAQRARDDPEFLEGFWRVVEGGGMVLYRRGHMIDGYSTSSGSREDEDTRRRSATWLRSWPRGTSVPRTRVPSYP